MSNIEFTSYTEIHEQQTEDQSETSYRSRNFRDGAGVASESSDTVVWNGPVRTLQARELLFEEGEARAHRAFKVETGAICCVRKIGEHRCEVIEFAVAGDIVGFGPFDTYMWSAEAVVETRVSALPADTTLDIDTLDEKARLRLSSIANREFTILRDKTVAAGRDTPALARVAALLLVLSATNAREGRDPLSLGDDLRCGAVADTLGFSVDDLSDQLVELADRRLITVGEGGNLALADLAALEKLADTLC